MKLFLNIIKKTFHIYNNNNLLQIINFKNLFLFSFMMLLTNNVFINFHSNNTKFFSKKIVQIDSIFTNIGLEAMSSVERHLEKGNLDFNKFFDNKFDNINEKKKQFIKQNNNNLIYDLASDNWYFVLLEGSDGNYNLEINLKKKINKSELIVVFDPLRIPNKYSIDLYENEFLLQTFSNLKNDDQISKHWHWIKNKIISKNQFNKIVLKIHDYHQISDRAHKINEVKVYELHDLNIVEKIKKFFLDYDKNFISYFFVSLLLISSIFIIGFPISFKISEQNDHLINSVLFGFLLITFFSIICFFEKKFLLLFIFYFLFSFFYLFLNEKKILNKKNKSYIFFSLICLFIYTIVHYVYSADIISGLSYFYDLIYDDKKYGPMALPFHDFYLPYDYDYHLPWATVKQLIHNLDKSSYEFQSMFGSHPPFERAMMTPLIGTFLIQIFYEKYFYFQCFFISFIFFTILGLLLLLEKYIKRDNLFLSILFLTCTPFFFWYSVRFAPNKQLAVCFLIFSLYFLIKYLSTINLKDIYFSCSFLFLGCVAHIFVLPYAASFIIFLIFGLKPKKVSWVKPIIIYSFTAGLGFGTYIIPKIYLTELDLFLYHVLGVKTTTALEMSNTNSISADINFLDNLKLIAHNKFSSFLTMFHPNPNKSINVFVGYRVSTIYGVCGLSFLPFLLIGLKNFFKNEKNLFISLLTSYIFVLLSLQVFFSHGVLLMAPIFTLILVVITFDAFLNYISKLNLFKRLTLSLIVSIIFLYENYLYFTSNFFDNIIWVDKTFKLSSMIVIIYLVTIIAIKKNIFFNKFF